jgi:uncharacterized protein with PIN domain
MAEATLRFFGSLNDFLPAARRGDAFAARVERGQTVKDLIEAAGVPHPEVDVVLVNGVSVEFGYPVREDDVIVVYPLDAAVEGTPNLPLIHLVAAPREPRFVLDVHLGRLAAYLRMLGFDTRYETACDDDVLARIAHDEARVLLTRDVGLLKRGAVVHGAFVRETQPERQAAEVARRYGLMGRVAPFTRCLRCNGLLAPVAKDEVTEQVPERVRQEYDTFQRCADCGQVYWEGTHHARMRALIARLLEGQE